MTNRVVWLNRHWYPVYIGLCPSVAAWKHAMKKLDVVGEASEFPCFKDRKSACVTTFTFAEKKKAPVSIIAFNPDYMPTNRLSLQGLILHECVHVWQKVRELMGERAPSQEFEAYALQDLWQQAVAAFDKTRRKRRA